MPFQNEITGGNGALVRPQIQSPNFQTGVSGWRIAKDGSAEFNNLTLRGTFVGTSYIQNTAGIFGYNGTPGAGTLTSSIAPAAGTDQFGNAYLAGICVYSTPQADGVPFIQLDPSSGSYLSGQWKSGAWDTANAASMQVLDADSGLGLQLAQYILKTPINTAFPDGVTMLLQGGAGAQTTGSGTAPQIQIFDKAGTSPVDTYLSGTLIKTSNSGTPQTWQDPTSLLGTGWAIGPSSGTVQALRYRKDALDNLVFDGTVHSTSTTPAATLFTLPSAYRPKVTRRVVCVSNLSGTPTARMVEINSNGGVLIENNLTTSATDVYLNFSVPLGNIA